MPAPLHITAQAATEDWKVSDNSASSSPRLVFKKRRGHKRTQFVYFDCKLFGKVSDDEKGIRLTNFTYWS